jgi:hypothetical protein
LELGGGRDNIFAFNVINGTVDNVAISFDNRGEGWAHGTCVGEMADFLKRVPYTDATWTAAFPSLAVILTDAPCTPRHNAIVGNRYCSLSHGFIDVSNDTVTSWGSTMYDNAPC